MLSNRRPGAGIGALLGLLVLSSCVDNAVVQPEVESDFPMAFAIMDGSTGGNPNFFFLQPLADQTPNLVGDFNPFLRPAMRVCVIEEVGPGLNQGCEFAKANEQVVDFPAGSVPAGSDKYQISWDTDGPETKDQFIKTNKFLLLEVLVAGEVIGSIQLDPQDPQGPGQSNADAYPFRLGETIPVKFWLSEETLCTGDIYVDECITGAVVNQEGANLSLEDEGNKLGVIIFQNSLPSSAGGEITVTVERIDPVAFFNATNEECIPGIGAFGAFDAPQFGDCFRVRTVPELQEDLLEDALVSICLDPGAIASFGLTDEQLDQLTMVRFDDGTRDEWEGLTDAFGDCPTQTASLMDVPESGFMRYAAMGINALASVVGPEEVEARDLKLGGLTSSFSRFRYALPGQMVPTDGNGAIIQATDDNTIAATINVIDHEGLPVENAIVHFETAEGTLNGPTETSADVVSDALGNATLQWTVDRSTAGDKTLTANALGLTEDQVPEHNANYLFSAEAVSIVATVVGPPAALGQDPDENIDDAVAGEPQSLTVIVTDAGGNFVEGAEVTWTCSDSCTVDPNPSTTNAAGEATVQWVPKTAGESQVSVASVSIGGVPDATFTATVAAGPAVEPDPITVESMGTAGLTLGDPLVITVTDEFGNPRVGDEVIWTVGANSGSVSATTTTVGTDGTTQVAWTLGQMVGENSLTVSVAGFSQTLTVTGEAGPAVQPTGAGSGQVGVVNEALATSLSITLVDQFGNPIVGETVNWSPPGSFAPASAPTNGGGVAEAVWTLGTTAGGQNAQAFVAGFTVDFSATAAPGVAASLGASPTTPQTAFIGETIPLSITVTDAFGNARDGDAVTWSVVTGGGEIQNAVATTGTGGGATASWVLGPVPGANTATVSAAGLSAGFSATGECFDGFGVATADGSFGASEWACALSLPFTANLSGGDTDAEVYWMNDEANLYLAVRVRRSSLDNVNSVRFDFDNDGDGLTEAGDDAIGIDRDGFTFLDEHLTSKCLNRNQSGCGDEDGSVDGAGAVANDGTWTTYELIHPLSSGDANDFSVSTGSVLGFYITLQQGNGAQGNTQFPDFRSYANITIVGF